VGSGYGERELDRLWKLLKTHASDKCPFSTVPVPLQEPSWIDPQLVVEVKFTEWTEEGLLRHPVYLGMREDVAPGDVRREPNPTRRSPTLVRSDRIEHTPARPRPVDGPAAAGSNRRVPRSSPGQGSPARKARSRAKGARLHDPALDTLIAALQGLEEAGRDGVVRLPNGETLDVTNLTKIFWPGPRITKGELLRYYARVSPWLLPVVQDRPLIMKRFPNGVSGKTFYQQRAPDDVPSGVRVEWVEEDEEAMPRLVGGSLTTLLYMTQLASISQDPWFSRVQSRHMADYVALDLDPMPGVPFTNVRDVARYVGEELAALDILAVPKTSGSSGLHVYIPLPPETPYETGQLFCQIVATVVATRHPELATTERAVAKRGRTVYVDYLQNIEGKSLATAYSARASEFAGVSTPLTWAELDGDLRPEDFTIRTVFARFEQVGDLWAPVNGARRADLRSALDKLARRY
jgi:bifunctional non-homologous end joining protein LigD